MARMDCEGEWYPAGGEGVFMLGSVHEAAPRLAERYAGQAKLIYLDPPFGTGDVFSMRSGGKTRRIPLYRDDLSREDYMAMMREALTLSHELLAPDGSLYLHVDYRMAAHLKLMLDEIFGEANFVNEIIWAYKSGGRATRHFSRKHDDILLYRKSARQYFDIASVGVQRGPERRNHMRRHVDEQGRICYSIRSGGKTYTYHEDSLVFPSDVWDDIEHLHQRDPERTGYSTQKPEALLRRILLASSRKGDLVIDLFSGSGTTAAAATKLERRWVAVDASPMALLTLRARQLADNCEGGMLRTGGAMKIEYIAKAPECAPPNVTVERRGGAYAVTAQDGSMVCLAAGRVQDGVFFAECCDISCAEGKTMTVTAEELTLLASDIYGNTTIWSY